MADRGRPRKGPAPRTVLLRMPATLLARVDQFKATLEAERGGFRINRTDLLTRLIDVGLQTLAQARQPVAQPQPASDRHGKRAPSVQEPFRQRQAPQPAGTQDLPPHILVIAATAAEYDKLSLAELSQLLYDRGIYRAKARDGSDVPVHRGTLQKWLGQARDAGVL